MKRPNPFKWLSLPTGLLYLWLFYQLLFTPAQMLQGFGVGTEPHTVFLAQRVSVLMLGFAVLVLLSLGLPRSKARAVNLCGGLGEHGGIRDQQLLGRQPRHSDR